MAAGEAPYGAIREGAVAVRADRIVWVGEEAAAPAELVADPLTTLDLDGGWITPGLIDAHTHLVFAGNRASEFEQRLGAQPTRRSRERAAAFSRPFRLRAPRTGTRWPGSLPCG